MVSPSVDISTQKVPVPYVVIIIHIRNGTVHIKDICPTDTFIVECLIASLFLVISITRYRRLH
jgi:hypothetical protein